MTSTIASCRGLLLAGSTPYLCGSVGRPGKGAPGSMELVEIPTPDETSDNTVPFRSPASLPGFACRLHWMQDETELHPRVPARIRQTLRPMGKLKQRNLIRHVDGSTLLLVDFEGPALQALVPDVTLASRVCVDYNGELLESSMRHHPAIHAWRLALRLKIKDPQRPVKMYAALVKGNRCLTEIWSYQLHAKE